MISEDNKSEGVKHDPSDYLPKVQFNENDMTVWGVKTSDGSKSIFEIMGYGLNIRFNKDLLNSVEDIELMLDGVKELFRKLAMQEFLKTSK